MSAYFCNSFDSKLLSIKMLRKKFITNKEVAVATITTQTIFTPNNRIQQKLYYTIL